MKKKLLILLVITLFSAATPKVAEAQSLAQLIVQLQLDYEKLAQLKQMLSDMYTGYKKIYDGYEQVRSIAKGNFDLHKAFLDALLAVSPIVRDYVKVQHIIDNEAALVQECRNAKSYLAGTGRFSPAELDAVTALYANQLDGGLRSLEELTDVLTDNTLRMSDAERLMVIDRIDGDMTSRLSALQTFDNANAIQAGQRGIEQNDLNTMLRLYGH